LIGARRRGEAAASPRPPAVTRARISALLCAVVISVSIFFAVNHYFSQIKEQIIFADTISKYRRTESHDPYIVINGTEYEVLETIFDAAIDGAPYICTVRTRVGKESREIVYMKSQYDVQYR
jgi:hypothetical protein